MSNTGRFVWYELLTSDPQGAIDFYTDVVGWKTQAWEQEAGYTMYVGSQGPVGGVTALPEQAKAMGAPPHWQANVVVEDVDATVAKVKELGGTVFHVESVPNIGRFAIIGDPQGAVIAAFTPARDMAPHDVSQPGEFSWHELYSSDHEKGFDFYQAIFGWERQSEMDMGPMGKYLMWGRQGQQLGGAMTLLGMKAPDGSDVPPSWMYYVTVADLDAAIERAKAKGARVLNGPMEVPGGQRIVQLMDPQGAAFALVTPPVAA